MFQLSGFYFKSQGVMVRLMIYKSCITLRTLDYGNYGIFLMMGNAGLISLNPKPQNPIDPLKEPLKGTLIDPFKNRILPRLRLGRLLFLASRRAQDLSGLK